MPIRIGRYNPMTAEEKDIRTLLTALQNIGSDAAAALPDSMRIEFQDGVRGGEGTDVFERLADWMNRQVSKAVLGQTMTTEDGSSRAQAEVHDKVRQDLRVADARQVAETLHRDLVVPFVSLNFGVQERYPRIRIPVPDPEARANFAGVVKDLAPLGLRLPAKAVRSRLGLPEPEDGDEVFGGRPAADARSTAAERRSLAAAAAEDPLDELDEIQAETLEDWEPLIDPVLKPLRAALASATSYEEFREGAPRTPRGDGQREVRRDPRPRRVHGPRRRRRARLTRWPSPGSASRARTRRRRSASSGPRAGRSASTSATSGARSTPPPSRWPRRWRWTSSSPSARPSTPRSPTGTTFRDFSRQLTPTLQKLGWWGRKEAVDPLTGKKRLVQLGSPRRLRTIYRANLRTARAAGQWDRAQRTKRALPYLLYQLGPSEEHREEHVAWAGTLLPIDDPWWTTHMPPNGWGCKCRVRQVSRREAQRRGGVTKRPPLRRREWVNKRTGEVEKVPEGIDPGWDTNPGKIGRAAAAKELLAEKEKGGRKALARPLPKAPAD